MKYKIIHTSDYYFSTKVFLEPHYFRFKPKTTPHNKLHDFELHIFPKPIGLSELIDVENNLIHYSWFEGLFEELNIRSESIIEVADYNPFNFFLYPTEISTVPFRYPEHLLNILTPALITVPIPASLLAYGKEIKRKVNSNTIEFLTMLTRNIQSDFSLIYRHDGAPDDPEKTFDNKTGSCRDLTWMQIQLLRHMGIASRFVSGYFFLPLEDTSGYELHAWLEVYLPGAGWVGFDPSHGIIAGNSHIPVTYSSNPENTLPVTGTVRGKATSKLNTNLLIEPLD